MSAVLPFGLVMSTPIVGTLTAPIGAHARLDLLEMERNAQVNFRPNADSNRFKLGRACFNPWT